MPRSSLRIVRPSNPIDETTERAAAAWAHDAPVTVLTCRTFGHAWSSGTDGVMPLSRTFYGRSLACSRCGTVRLDIYRRGEYGVWRRSYRYPSSYRRTATTGEESSATPRYVIQSELEARAVSLDPTPDLLEFYKAAVTR